MKKEIAILFYSFLILAGCTIDNQIEKQIVLDSFFNSEVIVGEDILKISDRITPLLLGFSDPYLILCKPEMDPALSFFNTANSKLESSSNFFIDLPLKLENPLFWGQIKQVDSNYNIWIYQVGLMKMTSINLNFYHADSSKIVGDFYLPPEIGNSVNIISLGDSLFAGSGNVVMGDFFIYNSQRGKLDWIEFPFERKKKAKNENNVNSLLGEYNRGIIKSKPDFTKFVKAFLYRPIITVHNSKGNRELIMTFINKKKTSDKSQIFSINDSTRLYFENIFLTDNYIYALFKNCSISKYNSQIKNNVEILVLDWEGRAVIKYSLDEGTSILAPFAIDELNHKIYTIHQAGNNSVLRVYNLLSSDKQ